MIKVVGETIVEVEESVFVSTVVVGKVIVVVAEAVFVTV
jgi:hypothetical protein